MKLILIIGFISLASCTFTKQQKAEGLIKEYMKQHLNDYDSYRVVNTKRLDTLYKDYLVDDSIGKSLFSLLLAQKGLVNIEDSLLTAYEDKPIDLQSESYITMCEKRLNKNKVKLGDLVNVIKERKNLYKKMFKGWSITQSYRAKNGFGALGLHTTRFEIDSTITKITGSEEINQ